jgi:hypothetical protein
MHMKTATKYVVKKLRFYRLSLTTSMENRMNLLMHLWQIIQSVNQA